MSRETIGNYAIQAEIYGILIWLIWRKRKDIKVSGNLDLTYYDYAIFVYWWVKLKKLSQ